MEPPAAKSSAPPPGFAGPNVQAPPGFGRSGSGSTNQPKTENDASSPSSTVQSNARGGHGGSSARGRGSGASRGSRKQQPSNQNTKAESETKRGGRGGSRGARGGAAGHRKPKLQNLDDSTRPAAAGDADNGEGNSEAIDLYDDSSLNSSESPNGVTSAAAPQLPDDWPVCLTCCEPIRWFCVGACNHSEVCARCCIKMRKLYEDKDCCICKKPLDRVIVTSERDKKFEELDEALREVPALMTQKVDGANLYILDTNYFKEVMSLFETKCPKCDQKFPSINSLCKHVGTIHNLIYCELCLKHRKVFLSEQLMFTSASQLAKHAERGNPEFQLKPHPWCKYCDVCFFSDEELFRHCEESHFKCWICERSNVLFNYFRDYSHLEEHFSNKHYPCEERECREKKFVVFRTQFELQAHMVSNHLGKKNLSRSETLAARTVQLNFSVRGSNSDAQDIEEANHYQQQQQQMYQNRIAGSQQRGPARPVETPVFFPDDTRRNVGLHHGQHHGHQHPQQRNAVPPPENFNADTGFSLSDRLPGNMQKSTLAPPPSGSSSASSTGPAPAAASSAQPQVSNLTPQERSKNLIAKIKAFLGDDHRFTEFRRISAMFKQSQMAPQHYYAQFLKTFGESPDSYGLFEEMVDLLPDIKKQQALLEMHRKHQRLAFEFPALSPGAGLNVSAAAAAVPDNRPVPATSGRTQWDRPNARVGAAPQPASAAPQSAAPRGPPPREAFPALGVSSTTEAFPALGTSSAASGATPAAPSWPGAPGQRNAGVTYSGNSGNKKGKKVLLRYG